MKNDPLYVQLKEIALSGNYSVAQAKALTFEQAASLLGTRNFTQAFLNNAKRGIVMALENRDDAATLDTIKTVVKDWLDENYPNHVIDRGRLRGKPYVTIWLDGII